MTTRARRSSSPVPKELPKKAKPTVAKKKKKETPKKMDEDKLVSFEGKTFLITGEFDMGKYGLQSLITNHGGTIVTSVTKSLGYLVCGKSGTTAYGGKTGKGTKKYKEAKKLKKPIVDEAWIIRQTTTKSKGDEVAALIDIPSVWESIVKSHETLGHPFTACKPATDKEISAAEERMGYPMPPQLKQLYKLTNGIPSSIGKIKVPWDMQFKKIEQHQSQSHYRPLLNFYRFMRMWEIHEYVHMDSSGLIFEWDTSFDSQCGNTIVADSLANYMNRWADELKTHVQKVKAAQDALSSTNMNDNVPSLPAEVSSIVMKFSDVPRFEIRDQSKEDDINKSIPYKSWFQKFKTAYNRNFGPWPQFCD